MSPCACASKCRCICSLFTFLRAPSIGRDLLEAAVDRGVIVRPPIDGTKYFAFADPSGGAHDRFTLGVSHREKDGSIVLELPARWNGAP